MQALTNCALRMKGRNNNLHIRKNVPHYQTNTTTINEALILAEIHTATTLAAQSVPIAHIGNMH